LGSGSWTSSAYVKHSTTSRGFTSMDEFKAASAQELYRSTHMDPALNPNGVIRECCDSEEHPYTKPVILALDVTGSMGSAAEAVAKQLNDIMTSAYEKVQDVEFMTMAIGDLSYDDSPIQASQFESDIRIAEQLEKVYFEGGGGGNSWESYTAAWYFGLHRTKLDAFDNRGQKGLIITIGDEPLNPYLPAGALAKALGIKVQGDVETPELYREVCEKFNIWHIGFKDNETSYDWYKQAGKLKGWQELLGDHFVEANAQTLAQIIADIIDKSFNDTGIINVTNEGIGW